MIASVFVELLSPSLSEGWGGIYSYKNEDSKQKLFSF